MDLVNQHRLHVLAKHIGTPRPLRVSITGSRRLVFSGACKDSRLPHLTHLSLQAVLLRRTGHFKFAGNCWSCIHGCLWPRTTAEHSGFEPNKGSALKEGNGSRLAQVLSVLHRFRLDLVRADEHEHSRPRAESCLPARALTCGKDFQTRQ